MLKTTAVLLAAFAAFAVDARAVTMEWSPVGNAGNLADPATGSLYGAVGYAYNIGTKDVTNSQYAEFLNTKDPTGANVLRLFSDGMQNPTLGGIGFNGGNPPGSRYVLTAGRQDHPVNFVNWFDAIRFANWLNNGGLPTSDTETGAYTLGALGAGGIPINNGNGITRNAGATTFLPSENEWYKAAYYDPRTTSQGGPLLDSHYWKYATGTNATPIASGPSGLANHANFNNAVGKPTDVGVYTGTTSPYGAFDMNGNVVQWNETLILDTSRGLRGGGYSDPLISLDSSHRSLLTPTFDTFGFEGFRVASVPEPSSLALAAFGLAALAAWGWRRNRS